MIESSPQSLYSAGTMNMKMSMVLPEDSLFRADLKKVLDLLYRKYKTEVENNDPMDMAIREFNVQEGRKKPDDLGAQIWLTRGELKHYNIALERCSEILDFLDKSKLIERTYDISAKPYAGAADPALFSVFLKFNFEDTHTLLLAKLNGSIKNQDTFRNNRLVTRDGRGNFFYDGKPIEMNKGTLHHDLLDILFSYADQDGTLSYIDIEMHLVERGHPTKDAKKEAEKRIGNILTNQLFKVAEVNGKPLKNKTLDGKKLIIRIRGEGLQFNNPLL